MSNLIFPPVTTNFRDLSDAISPTWLNGPNGAKYRYPMSVMYDGLADGMAYSIRAGLPSLAPSDAFQWLAQDRLIPPGFQESQGSYVARLQQWLDLWGFAGLPTSMLLAMLAFVTPAKPMVRTVDNSGNWNTYAANAAVFPAGTSMPLAPTYQSVKPSNWNWDGASDPEWASYQWWRMWVVIFSTSSTPFAPASATWDGGATWDSGLCWDWAGTVNQSSSLRQLARQWRAAHCWVPWIIVSYTSSRYDPAQPADGTHNPDGTWGHWGKVVSDATYGSKYVAARPDGTVSTFIDGDPMLRD